MRPAMITRTCVDGNYACFHPFTLPPHSPSSPTSPCPPFSPFPSSLFLCHHHHMHTLHLKNYQSTFYQMSSKDKEEEEEPQESLSYYPINAPLPQHNYPILPRSTPLSPNSYQSSPWFKTTPGQNFPSPACGPCNHERRNFKFKGTVVNSLPIE